MFQRAIWFLRKLILILVFSLLLKLKKKNNSHIQKTAIDFPNRETQDFQE